MQGILYLKFPIFYCILIMAKENLHLQVMTVYQQELDIRTEEAKKSILEKYSLYPKLDFYAI